LLLGVNIDHVATLREARGGSRPSPAEAAVEAVKGGADGITFHLREDRRHIQDEDLPEIRRRVRVPLNLEMALNAEIIRIALDFRPQKVCIVPERRREVTTEGGLDVVRYSAVLKRRIPDFRRKKIEASLFVAPSHKQIEAAARVGADAIEIHTGAYADASPKSRGKRLLEVRWAAAFARRLGLKVNAGHGLDYENVAAIAAIPELSELNIGHSIVSRSVFTGLREAVELMRRKMKTARQPSRS
jgi:pyridoxine 5-phosphate synthase